MNPTIVFVSDDVFFWARVHALAKSLGREAVRAGDDAAMQAAFSRGGVSRVIVDLSCRAVDGLGWAAKWKGLTPAPELVAFGSHVNEASLAAARAAGFDHVMPNSRFNRQLADWLA